jgi:ParB-like chromosome segregation protein Spo0J
MEGLNCRQKMSVLRALNDPIERARIVKATWLESGLTQDEFGRQIGCSQGQVAALCRLLQLPTAWRERVRRKQLSPTHADALLKGKLRPALLAAIEEKYFPKWHTPRKLPRWEKFHREVSLLDRRL